MKSFSIKDQKLHLQAFTHRSYLNEHPGKKISSNERLEFLGDSVLSFVVSDYLYRNFTHLPEGDLTNLRSLLVQAKTLGGISRELGFGQHLRMSRGEEEGGGKENSAILANTFEAYIGALFLDQGIDAVSQFIHQTLLSKIPRLLKLGQLKDDKSLLQEVVQEKRLSAPTYRILKSEGPDHAKTFTIGVFIDGKLTSQGTGRSKNEAEKDAAKKALGEWMKK